MSIYTNHSLPTLTITVTTCAYRGMFGTLANGEAVQIARLGLDRWHYSDRLDADGCDIYVENPVRLVMAISE